MARARCNVLVINSGGIDYEYTYYFFAPAYFLAREPLKQEKEAFVREITSRYIPRTLQTKPFTCAFCEKSADTFEQAPLYALHDPSALAINNKLVPVCKAPACHQLARRLLATILHKLATDRYHIDEIGPEMVSCSSCCKLGQTAFNRCGRCMGPAYCDKDCQRREWSKHKKACTGRVEAAKLTPDELAHIDAYVKAYTKGTMELFHLNHTGSFPEAQEQRGQGSAVLGIGKDRAEVRKQSWRRAQKNQAQNQVQQSDRPDLSHLQLSDWDGLRTDVIDYFV